MKMALIADRHVENFKSFNLYMAELLCYALQENNFSYKPSYFLDHDRLVKKRFNTLIGEAVLRCKNHHQTAFETEMEDMFNASEAISPPQRPFFVYNRVFFYAESVLMTSNFFKGFLKYSAFMVELALHCAREKENAILIHVFHMNQQIFSYLIADEFVHFQWNEFQRFTVRYFMYSM